MSHRLTKQEIDSILAQKNLLIRNLQITLGYHKVARALRKFVSDEYVNWFGFGTYASKTAGQALRHELLPAPLKHAMIRAAGYDNTMMYLHDVLETDDLEQHPPESLLAIVLSRVSLLVSEGNIMIFGELAWPFVDMVQVFKDQWQPEDDKWHQFLDSHFIPGPYEQGGQDFLREAFTSYYKARFETDAKKKAEWILIGNLLIGYHEQSRLQPVIEKALAVPFDVFAEGMIPEHEQETDNLREKAARRTIGFSRQMVLKAVTRMWMTYSLPTRQLKLGKDLVAPTGMVNFPPELLTIENPRAQELINMFNNGLDTLSGSAAANWGQLMDRMNFLADFFRSYQRYIQLLDPPFTKQQIEGIEVGQLPSGEL